MADSTAPQSRAPDASSEPAGDPSRSGLPDFLGTREPAPAPREEGAPVALRVLLMAVAILVIGFFLYREIARDAAKDDGVPAETEYQWSVVTPDGKPADLSSYKGRPVLLNVWATWCPPCLMEMPSLVALSQRPELKEANVAVVLVSGDQEIEAVRGFLERFDVGSADVLVAVSPPPKEFASAGLPATFIIAPDGRIVRREYGAMNWDSPAIAAQLAQLAQTPGEG